MSPDTRSTLVYVAGPMSGDPYGCVKPAVVAWSDLRRHGFTPFLPQLSVLHAMIDDPGYEQFMAYDFDVIRHCCAVLRLPGDSPGADREEAFALERGIPVFREVTDLVDELLYGPIESTAWFQEAS